MAEVFKFDGTLQCGLGKKLSIGAMQSELESLGVTVENAREDRYPGFLRAQCGAPTGVCFVFDVGEDDWPVKAKAILGAGYKPWPADDNSIDPIMEIMEKNGDVHPPFPWLVVNSEARNLLPKNPGETNVSDLVGMYLRVYRDGDDITSEYNPDRVNFVLDRSSGKIIRVYFG